MQRGLKSLTSRKLKETIQMNDDSIKASKMKTIKSTLLIALTIPLLSSCGSTYSSKFNCPDASGYGCTNIAVVYQRILSGKIEEIDKQKCRGSNCRAKKEREMKPELKELSPAVVEFVGK